MPEIIANPDAHYALNIVKTICTAVGPGLPASPQERERAAILKKELESHLGAENVDIEEFTLAPGAALSAFPLSALLTLIAALLNIAMGRLTGVSLWLTAIGALACSVLAPLLFILQFVFNLELVDPFFEKKRSINVIGTLRKPGTHLVKRLLILSGHHDSAPQNTWFSLLGNAKRCLMRRGPADLALEAMRLRYLVSVFVVIQATPFVGYFTMLVICSIQLAGVITGRADVVRAGTLGWVLLAYPIVPSILYGLLFTRAGKDGGTVPGAADNLSASALTVALCRFLVKNPTYIPADTEIRFISFGSEEAGLRGSRHYVERHLDELKRLDARLLNFETVAHPEIVILTTEGSGTVKNSPEMVNSVVAAAQRAGVPYQVKPAFLGIANDAAPFSQAGIRATTLLPFKVPEQLLDFYHQKWDRPEVLTIEPLLNVLKLSLEWISHCGQ
jgi:hypothetical protein